MKPIIKWMAIPVLAAGLLAPAHLTLAQDSSSSPDAKDATKAAAKDVGKGTKKVFHGNTGTADDSASSKPKPPSQ